MAIVPTIIPFSDDEDFFEMIHEVMQKRKQQWKNASKFDVLQGFQAFWDIHWRALLTQLEPAGWNSEWPSISKVDIETFAATFLGKAKCPTEPNDLLCPSLAMLSKETLDRDMDMLRQATKEHGIESDGMVDSLSMMYELWKGCCDNEEAYSEEELHDMMLDVVMHMVLVLGLAKSHLQLYQEYPGFKTLMEAQ